MEQKPPRKLLDQVSEAIRTKHYSYRTEQTYKDWIKRFILFHDKRHPAEMGAPERRQIYHKGTKTPRNTGIAHF